MRRGAVVVCKWTDSPTMDCPDVCLKAFWLHELEWVLEDCHMRSCWKNSIGVSVPRPCGSDAYVCSKSCWLCLTVVYWLLGCNKVPSWIENPEYVTVLLPDGQLSYSIFCFVCIGGMCMFCLLTVVSLTLHVDEIFNKTFVVSRCNMCTAYWHLACLMSGWSI
jgi:hypothetical protein